MYDSHNNKVMDTDYETTWFSLKKQTDQGLQISSFYRPVFHNLEVLPKEKF